MNITLFKNRRQDPPLLGSCPYDCTRRFHRLFHDIAQRTGTNHIAFTRHVGHFNRQQIAAHFRPGQTSYLSDLVLFFGYAEVEATHTQEIIQVFRGNYDFLDRGFILSGFGVATRLAEIRILFKHLLHDFAAQLADFALKRTNTGFTCVIAHNVAHGRFLNLHLAFTYTVVLHQLGQQMIECNMHFFIFRVARQPNHFHTVEQCRWNVQRIAGCHEHHVRQVEVDFDIVILECMILLGVEHFQKARRRVATEIRTHFVDLIEQEQGVTHAHLGHVLQNLARHRTDIGAAMATNFSFIAHATQRHAHKLAVCGASD